jgi:hypothetical protein
LKNSSNPKLYGQMCEPFENQAEANEALTAFFEDVKAAREKHGITDVHLILSGYTAGGEDDPGAWLTSAHIGSPREAEAMCAWALGKAQEERRAMIADFLSIGKTKR